jgi:hypothetical protein
VGIQRLGLFRLAGYDDRQWIESELSVDFQDVYDALDDVRSNVRELERDLDAIFQGTNATKMDRRDSDL